MKKSIIIIYLLAIFISVYTIDFNYGTRNYVREDNKNSQLLFYHNNSDDFHFYGSNKWAVNFKISEILDNAVTDSFNVSGTRIYIPETPNHPQGISNIKVYLYNDFNNRPGDLLYHNHQNLITLYTGWNDLNFGDNFLTRNAWVVFEIPTSENGPFIVGSQGTGRNSYFWDSFNSSEGTFVSMNNLGYDVDFLVDLKGTFKKPIMIIEIEEINLPNDLNPGEALNPYITLKNNSPTTANEIFFTIQVLNNSAGVNIIDTVFVAQPLPQGESITINDYDEDIILPDFPAQYAVTFTTSCVSDNNAVFKRRKIRDIDVFTRTKDRILIDIFADTREQTDNQIISMIENSDYLDSSDIIFHFPTSLNLDPMHTIGAYQRSLQYMQLGTQHTFFNGRNKISYYNSNNYMNLFDDNYNLSMQDRTFLSNHNVELRTDSNNLILSFTISNEDTYLLQTHNQVSANRRDLVFHAAIIQKNYYDKISKDFTVLSQFITDFSTGKALTLNRGLTEDFDITFPYYSLNLLGDNSLNDLNVLIWIQNNFNKQIYYHDIISMANLEFNYMAEHSDAQTSIIESYPNPTNFKSGINLNLYEKDNIKNISANLYNIKGQKVKQLIINNKSYSNNIHNLNINIIEEHNNLSSGIYFIKLNWTNNANQAKTQFKKILYIK